jgi:hypothetical protein
MAASVWHHELRYVEAELRRHEPPYIGVDTLQDLCGSDTDDMCNALSDFVNVAKIESRNADSSSWWEVYVQILGHHVALIACQRSISGKSGRSWVYHLRKHPPLRCDMAPVTRNV